MKKSPKRPISEEAMRLRLADLCARTEQCEADLRKKILRAGLPSDGADRITAFLNEEGFLNESRFAGAFARDKVRFSNWGRLKIRQGLIAKRISSTAISEALSSIDHKEYLEALRKSALSKARSLNLEDRDDIQKLYRHLLSKGFESAMVSRIIELLRKAKAAKN